MVRSRDIGIALFFSFIGTPILLGSLSLAAAQVMQSTNYRLQQDSINFSGGLSTSTNYSLESSAGEAGTGDRSSTSFNLRGGYQQLDTNFIAISTVAPVVMVPALAGITGGTANGSTTVTVTTDSPAGYELSIAAAQTPALQKGSDSIADYAPVGAVPDLTFTTGSTQSHFGYSPSGTDIVLRFKDNGSVCGAGSSDTALSCWDGLDVVDEAIARGNGSNVPSGTDTVLYFRVGIGGSVGQPSGTYTATTTVTAISL